MNVTRTPQLSTLHSALWDEATAAGTDIEERYATDRWFPHLSRAEHRPSLELAARLRSMFERGLVPSHMPTTNLALIEETPDGHDIVRQIALRGDAPATTRPPLAPPNASD